MRRTLRFALPFAMLLLCTQRVQATTIHFEIILDGLQEVPPVATPGYGTGTLTLDDATGAYTTSGTFSDLLGVSTAAHIHGPAAGGSSAAVVAALTFDAGVYSGAFSGAGTFDAAQMSDLLDELYYVNIHSAIKPGGEIRGQILLTVPEPGSLALLSFGGVLLTAAARWRTRRRT